MNGGIRERLGLPRINTIDSNRFTPDLASLEKVSRGILEKINAPHQYLRGHALSLAGLSSDSTAVFAMQPLEEKFKSVNVIVVGQPENIVFSLSIGVTSLVYTQRNMRERIMIDKTKLLKDIQSPADAIQIVEDFIRRLPTEAQIYSLARVSPSP